MDDFETKGLLKLSGVVDQDVVKGVREAFWREISSRFQIYSDAPESWSAHFDGGQKAVRARRLSGMNPIMKTLTDAGELSTLQASIQQAFDETFGKNKWEPSSIWYSLLNFPGNQTEWNVPHKSWHADEPIVVGDSEPWTIFTFVFLDTVDHGGGSTTAVTGSHRRAEQLAEKIGTRDEMLIKAFESTNSGLVDPKTVRALAPTEIVRNLAKEDAWFRNLITEGAPNSPESDHSVVELTGDPGDLILLDPRCLHSGSDNISDRPREVIRIDFKRVSPNETG